MLQYFYDDEILGVVDISLRCRLYRTQVKSSAEEGEASISTLIVDDPAGDLILNPFRQIYIVETDAPTNEKVVYRGYISDREIRRGPYRIGAGREWVVQLSDPNWLIGLRIVVGADANRPAETDLARVQWLLTTTEANTFNGDDTYVNTTVATVAMDAADYRGQNVTSILDDCAQATGKNWWVVFFEAIGQYGLWYDFAETPIYDSAISLSNGLADIDNSIVFAISQENTTLERSPSRLVSGVYLPYDGGNVYVQNPVVGSNFIFRDAAAPSVNVKTLTKATARANRYLADADTEEDVIHTEVILPAAQINDIMQGMRIPFKATHLPDYEAYTWMRALNRTVTETSEEFLTVGLELSPLPGLIEPSSILYETHSGDTLVSGTPIGIYYRGSGDDPPSGYLPVPTVGPITPNPSGFGPGNQKYQGWIIDGTGTIDLFLHTTVAGVPLIGDVVTVSVALNGGVIDSASLGPCVTNFSWPPGPLPDITITGLSVVPGDVIYAQIESAPRTGFFVPAGVGDTTVNFRITGGALV